MSKNAPTKKSALAAVKQMRSQDPIELTTPDDLDEQVELFSIDGKSYMVNAVVPVSVALEFMEKSQDAGDDGTQALAVQQWLLREVLGEEQYQSLLAWKGLTLAIYNRLTTAVLGRLIDTEGVDD